MRVPLLVLLVAPWFTQDVSAQTVPEVRGTVVESGSTTPIPGAEVTLREFGPNEENFIVNKAVVSAITDGNGGFVLRPGHLGEFTVEAKKDGYTAAAGLQAVLNAASPAQSIRMSLIRPGTLTGRVIDANGNPVPNFKVRLEYSSKGSAQVGVQAYVNFESALTNGEGVFTAVLRQPGAYWVRVQPKEAADGDDLMEFTAAAFQVVDEDVEPSYWPGGAPTREQILPVNVTAGGIANAGTITLRKVPYYRVRLTLNRDCEPNERWILRLRTTGDAGPVADRYSACRKDGLITGVAPGNYDLAIWRGREVDRWARASFIVTKENTTAAIVFSDSVAVSGRVIAAEGGDLTKLGQVKVMLRSSEGLPSGDGVPTFNDAGEFRFARVPWTAQLLSVEPSNPDTYVKEVRYNGLPLRGPDLDAISGSKIDVVLDSQAAKLNVMLKTGQNAVFGWVLLFPASATQPPKRLAPFPPFVMVGIASRTPGLVTVSNIPPGEYRIVPIAPQGDEDLTDPNVIAQRFARAEKITLGRGEQKSIELQVK